MFIIYNCARNCFFFQHYVNDFITRVIYNWYQVCAQIKATDLRAQAQNRQITKTEIKSGNQEGRQTIPKPVYICFCTFITMNIGTFHKQTTQNFVCFICVTVFESFYLTEREQKTIESKILSFFYYYLTYLPIERRIAKTTLLQTKIVCKRHCK